MRKAGSVAKLAARCEAAIEKAGFRVQRTRIAQTRSVYISADAPSDSVADDFSDDETRKALGGGSSHIEQDDDFVVRVADHADAYGISDYTVDGQEGTIEGLRVWLKARQAARAAREKMVITVFKKAGLL